MNEFDYLDKNKIYLDSACQSIRPKCVIDKMQEYYVNYNACGGRGEYNWAQKTDDLVFETRQKILNYIGLSARKFFVSFTLNTTYGLNLILQQLNPVFFDRIITSEIEHNSVFLSSMGFAKKFDKERVVLERKNGSLVYENEEIFERAIVIANVMSNFDGQKLTGIKELIDKVHEREGIVILDAAQAMAHDVEILKGVEADAICFSGHKMYSPSIGVIVAQKSLLGKLEPWFLGGGMVDDVSLDNFILSEKAHPNTRFEMGLLGWAEIIGLGRAIDWLEEVREKKGIFKKSESEMKANLDKNKELVYNIVMGLPRVKVVGEPVLNKSSLISFYIEGTDSHLLARALSKEGVMARAGYFCVHYYLGEKLGLPPLLRFSLGYHNGDELERLKNVLNKLS